MTLYAKDIIREEIRNIGNLATNPSATISTEDVVAAATRIINDVVVPQMAEKIKAFECESILTNAYWETASRWTESITHPRFHLDRKLKCI